ncbi:MAG: HAMP domain-containing sensor histidine kinase [Leifsonia sp.]
MTAGDLRFIVATTFVCTAVVFLAAAVLANRVRRASLGWRFAVVLGAAIVSIACSTVAVSAGMYFSAHDLDVLFWIVSVSAVFSVGGAWLVTRGVRRSIAALTDSARRIADGEVVAARSGEAKELAVMSAQLADTSERLAAARAELERLDAARSTFFSWISHDLRTPLTGVRALAEALEDGMVDEPREYAARIRQQVDTMSRLVDDLFELSRLQSGTLRPRLERVDLLDVVSDAVADVRPLAEEREVSIAHGDVGPRTVLADPYLLGRVLVNLLANAVRHAPAGSAVVVSAERTSSTTVIHVTDEGRGVAQADLGRMFEVGWLADPARTPDRGPGASGAGLGLAIVRAVVTAHRGSVRAAHVPQGFRLTVELP